MLRRVNNNIYSVDWKYFVLRTLWSSSFFEIYSNTSGFSSGISERRERCDIALGIMYWKACHDGIQLLHFHPHKVLFLHKCERITARRLSTSELARSGLMCWHTYRLIVRQQLTSLRIIFSFCRWAVRGSHSKLNKDGMHWVILIKQENCLSDFALWNCRAAEKR